LYGIKEDNASSSLIMEGEGFEMALLNVHDISKAATITPKHIQPLENVRTAANIKPLCPIRDHEIRWNGAFNMFQCALYLRKVIDHWTLSNPLFT
jgi:hypothetical protein